MASLPPPAGNEPTILPPIREVRVASLAERLVKQSLSAAYTDAAGTHHRYHFSSLTEKLWVDACAEVLGETSFLVFDDANELDYLADETLRRYSDRAALVNEETQRVLLRTVFSARAWFGRSPEVSCATSVLFWLHDPGNQHRLVHLDSETKARASDALQRLAILECLHFDHAEGAMLVSRPRFGDRAPFVFFGSDIVRRSHLGDSPARFLDVLLVEEMSRLCITATEAIRTLRSNQSDEQTPDPNVRVYVDKRLDLFEGELRLLHDALQARVATLRVRFGRVAPQLSSTLARAFRLLPVPAESDALLHYARFAVAEGIDAGLDHVDKEKRNLDYFRQRALTPDDELIALSRNALGADAFDADVGQYLLAEYDSVDFIEFVEFSEWEHLSRPLDAETEAANAAVMEELHRNVGRELLTAAAVPTYQGTGDGIFDTVAAALHPMPVDAIVRRLTTREGRTIARALALVDSVVRDQQRRGAVSAPELGDGTGLGPWFSR